LRLTLAEVPAYLQKGELLQNEDTGINGFERISVPKNCLKQMDSVRDDCELSFLHNSFRYWAVEELPESVYAYLSTQRHAPSEHLRDIAQSFPAIRVSLSLFRRNPQKHLAIAAHDGDLRLLKYLRKQGHVWQGTECCAAAATGQLTCLQYAHEDGCGFGGGRFGGRCACTEAFCKGQVDCLQYAHERKCNASFIEYSNCDLTSIECLQYILDRPTEFLGAEPYLTPFSFAAVRLGSISCVQKACSLGWHLGYEWYATDLFETALSAGNPAVLEYVIKEGCRLAGHEADKLVSAGRTDSLPLLLDRGQRLKDNSMRRLRQMGEIDVIKEVIDRQCCNLTVVAAMAAADVSYLSLLVFVLEKGYHRSPHVCVMAAAAGNLTTLRWAAEHGCTVTEKVCLAAAGRGHLSCLQYAVDHGSTITTAAQEAAVRGDHVDCLQCLHEQGGCVLTPALVGVAISADAVRCVQYVHEHGCWLECTAGALKAAKAGSLECLTYYHGQAGPQRTRTRPWDTVWAAARRSQKNAVRKYAKQRG
jgi:hypothetical protein